MFISNAIKRELMGTLRAMHATIGVIVSNDQTVAKLLRELDERIKKLEAKEKC